MTENKFKKYRLIDNNDNDDKKEKYNLATDITGNCFIVNNDYKFGMFDKLERTQVIRIIDKLNEQDEEIKQLKKEVLELRAEIGRLNHKKEKEHPHWLKYENNKGYSKKINQDIRFKGDGVNDYKKKM